MNTQPSMKDQPSQPSQPGQKPGKRRRPHLPRRAALVVTCLAGAGTLLLAVSGTAFATVDQTSPQWAELGPDGYTGGQVKQVTEVYTIQNSAEIGTQMLEDNGSSMNQGGTVDVWNQIFQTTNQYNQGPAITQANYLWEFVPANPANGPSITDGPGQLINRQSGLCLDLANNNTGNNAAIDQWTCNDGANQQWQAISVGGGNYEIASALDSNGKVLGIGTQSTCILDGNGDSVSVYTADQYNTCEWWNIQQASYDYATYPVTAGYLTDDVDNRAYECVPTDKFRMTDSRFSEWAYDNASDSGVDVRTDAAAGGSTGEVPGGFFAYSQSQGSGADLNGQAILYCDPQQTAP